MLDLDPFLITCDVNNEVLVIQININGINIRVINGFGPQEVEDSIKVYNFWQAIENEVIIAKEDG